MGMGGLGFGGKASAAAYACMHATHPDELEGGVLEARLNLHHRLLGLVFVSVTILAREMQ